MSYRLSIDPKERKVGRFINRVRRELQKVLDEEKSARRLTQADIARALKVDRAVINRQLRGAENLTLRRVAEFAWVLGRDLNFSMPKPAMRENANHAGSQAPHEIPLLSSPPSSEPTADAVEALTTGGQANAGADRMHIPFAFGTAV